MPLPFLLPLLGGLAGGVSGGLTTGLLNQGVKSDYTPRLPQAGPMYNPNVPQYSNVPQPITPQNTYNQAQDIAGQAQAVQMSQYGMSNPFGKVSWSGNTANGTRMLNVSLSPFEQDKQEAAKGMLPSLANNYGDAAAQRAENSVYDSFQRRMNPQFQAEQERLHTKLLNQGLPVGSDAYKNSMASLQQGQRNTQLDAMNRSVLTGQQSRTNELNNALGLFGTMSNINNPMNSYVPGLGGNFTSAYQNMQTNKHLYDQMGLQSDLAKMNNKLSYDQMAHQTELEKHRTQAQAQAAKMNAATQFELANMQAARERQQANRKTNSSIGSGISGALGKLFSDARIKENIVPVGKLYNGLTVYKFNFKGEPTLRIGLIAQEVKSLIPEAVSEDAEGSLTQGLLVVDYDLATITPEEIQQLTAPTQKPRQKSGGSNND